MINKIYIDQYAYEYLNEWAEDNKDYVMSSPPFFKKTIILLKNDNVSEVQLVVEKVTDKCKFSLLYEGNLIIKGYFNKGKNESDFDIRFTTTKLIENELKEYSQLIQLYINAYLIANAFLWYGNLLDDKSLIASGRNSDSGKIIVFKKYKESLFAVPINHHRSPEGVFAVRGHLRKLKSGKIIWIDEYLKGVKNKAED